MAGLRWAGRQLGRLRCGGGDGDRWGRAWPGRAAAGWAGRGQVGAWAGGAGAGLRTGWRGDAAGEGGRVTGVGQADPGNLSRQHLGR